MTEKTAYVVMLPLTDEQIDAFVQGSETGNTPDESLRRTKEPHHDPDTRNDRG